MFFRINVELDRYVLIFDNEIFTGYKKSFLDLMLIYC